MRLVDVDECARNRMIVYMVGSCRKGSLPLITECGVWSVDNMMCVSIWSVE